METKEMIETLRYKAMNIKAKIEPDFFYEVADVLEEQTWISVDDRLPPKPQIGEDGYIVQKKNVCEPFSAYWDGYKWTDNYNEIQDGIIAWMPLPETYKGWSRTTEETRNEADE